NGAPGLRWRSRANGFVAVWVARADIVRRGYHPKTQRLWPPTNAPAPAAPSEADTRFIRSECIRLQSEMLGWANGGDVSDAPFTRTVAGLIDPYRRDPDSNYQKLRLQSKRTYDVHLDLIEAEKGERALFALKGRDFLRWFREWSEDGRHISSAHARITMWRLLLTFGATII